MLALRGVSQGYRPIQKAGDAEVSPINKTHQVQGKYYWDNSPVHPLTDSSLILGSPFNRTRMMMMMMMMMMIIGGGGVVFGNSETRLIVFEF
jgi:hypothetical protein